MPNVIGSAEFELRADKSPLLREFRGAEADARKTGQNIERDFKTAGTRAASGFGTPLKRMLMEQTALSEDLGRRYERLGFAIGDGMRRGSQMAQVALIGVSTYSLKLIADAKEIDSAFDVAFGNASKNAREFSEVLASKVGRDAVELREKMTRLQLVLTGTGIAASQATQLVQALTTAGVDAGSLFNTSDAEALQKIVSGLTGETEPLKAFGVVVNDAALKAELLRLGFKGTVQEASEAAKSVARANLILKGLAVAQGDAERTADSAANKTKAMRAEFNKAARELGEQLLPAFLKAAGGATDLLKAFNSLPDGVQAGSIAILAFIAAGGPIAGLMVNLGKLIKLARDTRLALAGIGGASAAAAGGSAAGGALAGGALATGVRLGGVATAPLILSGDTRARNDRERLERLRDEERRIPTRRGIFYDREGALAKVRAEIAEIEARQAAEMYGAGAGKPGEASAADTNVVGGFSLTPDQLKGNGTSGSGKKSGPSPQELAAARQDLEDELAIVQALAREDEAAAQALKDKVFLRERTAVWAAAEHKDAAGMAQKELEAEQTMRRREEAIREADQYIEDQIKAAEREKELQAEANRLRDREIEQELVLAQIRGDSDEIERLSRLQRKYRLIDEGYSPEGADKQVELEEDAEMQGKFRDFFRGGLRAALEGDFGEFFQRWIAEYSTRGLEESLDKLADSLWRLFKEIDWGSVMNPGGGFGGGAGNWLSKGASKVFSWGSSIFGGGRAGGGPVEGGRIYDVGEFGRERLLMPSDGYVIPEGSVGATGGESAGQVAVHMPIQVDARGATEDGVKLLNQKLDQIVRELPGTIVGVVNDGLSRRTIRN